MSRTDPRDLTRVAEALNQCAHRLERRDSEDAPHEVDRVQRTLRRTAAALSSHALTVRRLDNEIELLERRRGSGDLSEMRRRRDHAERRLRHAVDDATRALIPGGDRLDPTTILRRLSGPSSPPPRSYFGRPAVDRSDRVRRLTSLLLRTTPHPGATWTDPRLTSVIVPSRNARLARIRHRLLGITPTRATPGAGS